MLYRYRKGGVIAREIVASRAQAPPTFCTEAKVAKGGAYLRDTTVYALKKCEYINCTISVIVLLFSFVLCSASCFQCHSSSCFPKCCTGAHQCYLDSELHSHVVIIRCCLSTKSLNLNNTRTLYITYATRSYGE